jgi:hypothetical protein
VTGKESGFAKMATEMSSNRPAIIDTKLREHDFISFNSKDKKTELGSR